MVLFLLFLFRRNSKYPIQFYQEGFSPWKQDLVLSFGVEQAQNIPRADESIQIVLYRVVGILQFLHEDTVLAGIDLRQQRLSVPYVVVGGLVGVGVDRQHGILRIRHRFYVDLVVVHEHLRHLGVFLQVDSRPLKDNGGRHHSGAPVGLEEIHDVVLLFEIGFVGGGGGECLNVDGVPIVVVVVIVVAVLVVARRVSRIPAGTDFVEDVLLPQKVEGVDVGHLDECTVCCVVLCCVVLCCVP
mmetsp:Transcript_16692/g.34853  ORF Transcript_16692/g.34853 Transcript_16692/m.34853 type:complete len:242 (-) Transcript_16692:252-977(-)